MTTDQFINEVDEELKHERHMALWHIYGRYAVAGVLLIVIGVASVVGWRHYQENRRAEAGIAFVSAVESASAPPNRSRHSRRLLKMARPALPNLRGCKKPPN
jgi:hypothetical protein